MGNQDQRKLSEAEWRKRESSPRENWVWLWKRTFREGKDGLRDVKIHTIEWYDQGKWTGSRTWTQRENASLDEVK